MSSFESRLARARTEMTRPAWDETRAERAAGGMHAKVRRRARVRTAAALAMVPLLVVGAMVARGVVRSTRVGMAPTNVAARESRTMRIEGGATTVTLASDANLETIEATEVRTVLRLTRGRARFDVGHRDGRTFRVEAGSTAVQVLGTAFTVERAGEGARVAVASGRVRVFFADRYADLGAGEDGLFPSAGAANASASNTAPTAEQPAPANVAPASADAPSANNGTHREASSAPTWRSYAARGNYDEAYSALRDAGFATVRDEVGDLFTASDVARLSGHPSESVAPLNRVLAHHGDDARAPLAAFTLGRVLLEDMGQAREAASAFARIRSMADAGALAEDALAREVEAWSRAGDSEHAQEAATLYLSRYPEGRAARRVRRFGGLP